MDTQTPDPKIANYTIVHSVVSMIFSETLHVDIAMPFYAFSDLEQSVRDDIAALQSSPLLLAGTPVRGFIYDVHTGMIAEVR